MRHFSQNQRFITLCCVLQVCVLVEGLYQLEVTVFGYNNPTGRCQDCNSPFLGGIRGCCDNLVSTSCAGRDLCDSSFTYCLRTIGSTERGCSYFGIQRSDSNTDDRPLDFSQSRVLGLENPIILQGLTNTYLGVQLHIEITDNDRDVSDDLIDALLINHNLPIGQQSPRQNYSGIYNFSFVTMDLSITARCVGNFQGSDCLRCLAGFAGIMCNISINECTCSRHGQCLDGVPSLICNCDPGFTGVECETNIDDCEGVNCSGNGQCMDGLLSYTCDCDPGFTGVDCEVDIDDCVGVNCSGNGVCLDDVNAFACQCSPGFGGTLCTEVTGIRGGSPLVLIMSGAIGGVLILIIILVLIVMLFIRIRHKPRQPNVDASLSIGTKKNVAYGVSMAIVPGRPQTGLQDYTRMSRNPCYATTQHIEIVGDECYSCVPESQPTDPDYSYITS